jgi:hypothetical protein
MCSLTGNREGTGESRDKRALVPDAQCNEPVKSQKRPAVEAKETCYRGKRDLL